MRLTVVLTLLLVGCGTDLPGPEPMPAQQQADAVIVSPPTPVSDSRCAWPAGDQVIVTSCPGICKVCIAYSPAGAIDVNLAGCALQPPDILCAADCNSPCE